MTAIVETAKPLPWWKEPTKDQWMAWWAGWLGWTLDAFDFTVFLLIMVPIAKEFNVSLTEVTAVFTITLWMRLVGACASGWLADRVGRRTPLMISIAWYSICNFVAGFAPTFWFLFLFRALLGIGMGAEWPAGAAQHLQAPAARQHPDRLLVDDQRVRDLLLDLVAVRDAPAEGPQLQPRPGCDPDRHRQLPGLPRQRVLGMDGRSHRPPLVDDHPGDHHRVRGAALPADQRHQPDQRRLHPPGLVRGRPLRPEPELSLGALPDRGAGGGQRLLLPPGGDLRRPGGAPA